VLPLQLKGLHPVFHTRLLRRWHDPTLGPYRTVVPPPDPIVVDGNLEYEIDRIIGQRMCRNRLQYCVRWKGYDDEEATWENADKFDDCVALDDWLRQNPKPEPSKNPSKGRKQRRRR
jgi:hypothetical protein